MTNAERLLNLRPDFSVKEIARYLISHNSVPRVDFLMKADELTFLLNRIQELELKVKEQGDLLSTLVEDLKDQIKHP